MSEYLDPVRRPQVEAWQEDHYAESEERIYVDQVEALMSRRGLSDMDREIVRGILFDVPVVRLAEALDVTRETIYAHQRRLGDDFEEFLGL